MRKSISKPPTANSTTGIAAVITPPWRPTFINGLMKLAKVVYHETDLSNLECELEEKKRSEVARNVRASATQLRFSEFVSALEQFIDSVKEGKFTIGRIDGHDLRVWAGNRTIDTIVGHDIAYCMNPDFPKVTELFKWARRDWKWNLEEGQKVDLAVKLFERAKIIKQVSYLQAILDLNNTLFGNRREDTLCSVIHRMLIDACPFASEGARSFEIDSDFYKCRSGFNNKFVARIQAQEREMLGAHTLEQFLICAQKMGPLFENYVKAGGGFDTATIGGHGPFWNDTAPYLRLQKILTECIVQYPPPRRESINRSD